MKIKEVIAWAGLIVGALLLFGGNLGTITVGPVGNLTGYVLGVHDLDNAMPKEQQSIVDGPEIRDWMDAHGLKGHYRFSGPNEKFGDDSPFQKLIDKPRAQINTLYAGDYSCAMPATIAEAEAIIGKYAK